MLACKKSLLKEREVRGFLVAGAMLLTSAVSSHAFEIAYSERDPRAEPLGEILERVVIARGCQIRVEMDDAVRALPVPATQVQLIVDELVSNAATAVRGKDHAEITIRASLLNRRFPFARRLVLDVADNGGGMQPDVVEKATVPFFSTRAGAHVGRSDGLRTNGEYDAREIQHHLEARHRNSGQNSPSDLKH
ncbi:MAG: hypothetical protein E5V16_09125 [Mesorhizobium sp.]|nr:MAG: hypothetical protein EOS62_04415 [Mesorhizobium sp.]TIX04477.1 MAG: hypothetical protein E5V57_14630 [Mesorhizobium sp.]TIY10875.1 MAG: hypothetical protein E5V16_09125 [Mesorhizobium sp.]